MEFSGGSSFCNTNSHDGWNLYSGMIEFVHFSRNWFVFKSTDSIECTFQLNWYHIAFCQIHRPCTTPRRLMVHGHELETNFTAILLHKMKLPIQMWLQHANMKVTDPSRVDYFWAREILVGRPWEGSTHQERMMKFRAKERVQSDLVDLAREKMIWCCGRSAVTASWSESKTKSWVLTTATTRRASRIRRRPDLRAAKTTKVHWLLTSVRRSRRHHHVKENGRVKRSPTWSKYPLFVGQQLGWRGKSGIDKETRRNQIQKTPKNPWNCKQKIILTIPAANLNSRICQTRISSRTIWKGNRPVTQSRCRLWSIWTGSMKTATWPLLAALQNPLLASQICHT